MNKWSLSGRVLMPEGIFREATLFLEEGGVAGIQPGLDLKADLVTPGYISPGWIDLQINGAYGFDFSRDGSTVAGAAERLPETGVTSFLPTLITSPWEDYPKRFKEIKEAMGSRVGAQPLGIHLEGPYLNPLKKGAHNQDFLRVPVVEEMLGWVDTSVRLVTLAPELPGAREAARWLHAKGIVVSAGHSEATYEEALEGFRAGIGWVTHLFNAMRSLGHREPGLPGAALTSTIPCGLIADGIHTHPAIIRLAFQAKGTQGITLVTDAMEAMGMPPGRYKLSTHEVFVDDNSARLADGTLAGSILTLDQAVRNTIRFTGCSVEEALMMASTSPARVLGLETKGLIAVGCDADLVVLDESLQVTHTFARGHPVYIRDRNQR